MNHATGFERCPHTPALPEHTASAYCADCYELARARIWYFLHGGQESDLGPRAHATWYYRRAVIALDDKVGQLRELLTVAEAVIAAARGLRSDRSALLSAVEAWDTKQTRKA